MICIGVIVGIDSQGSLQEFTGSMGAPLAADIQAGGIALDGLVTPLHSVCICWHKYVDQLLRLEMSCRSSQEALERPCHC